MQHGNNTKVVWECETQHSNLVIKLSLKRDNHATMPEWFKGIEIIIQEQRLWPDKGLNAQCKGFKCFPGKTNCCCHCLLFTQPDFVAQKSHLEELINLHGHICDFYLKYHCKLNFIEQYWGAAKFHYQSTSKTSDINEMEQNVLGCLEKIPQLQILRYVVIFLAWKIFLQTCYLYLVCQLCSATKGYINDTRNSRLWGRKLASWKEVTAKTLSKGPRRKPVANPSNGSV